MNKVPKCKPKFLIPHQNNLKISQKESFNEHLVPKITQRNLKFSGNRNFGKDISNSIKNNFNNVKNMNYNNNQSTKLDSNNDKKANNNNIYIKKHSSASQVAQKTQKIKIAINDKKLRENKSGANITKKHDISVNKENNKNINNKKEIIQNGSKLHSSISFGGVVNANNTNSSITRVSFNKNNNNNNISNNNNNINNSNVAVAGNNKKDLRTSNIDLM